MTTSGYVPRFKPGKDLTYVTTADVLSGQVVVLTGDYSVGPAGANSALTVGVATHDAPSGSRLVVSSGGVQRPIASGAIAAGARVSTAAAGKVATVTSTNPTIGTCLAAAADGAPADIRFDV